MSADPRQWIVTLDLEGVLVPEIWIAVAERTAPNRAPHPRRSAIATERNER